MEVQDLLNDLQGLQKAFYNSDSLKETFRKYDSMVIIRILQSLRQNKADYGHVLEFISEIVRTQAIYKEFLFKDTEVIKALLMDPDTDVRALVPLCIETHNYEIAVILCELYAQQNYQSLGSLLQVLFCQLSDPESEVGLKTLRVFKKIFSNQQLLLHKDLISIAKGQVFLTQLLEGIQLKDDVIRLRFMEITIDISNLDVEIHQTYKDSGLLQKVVDLYNTDDLLVKLNVVELITLMGNSQWNAGFLKEQKFFKEILDGAMNTNEEFYVRKYQVLLLSKMICWRVNPLTKQIEKKLVEVLQCWLSDDSVEVKEASFEIIGMLSQIQEGMNCLVQQRELVDYYFSLSTTTKESLKLKFLGSLKGFFMVDTKMPKQPTLINYLFTKLGKKNQESFQAFAMDAGLMAVSSKLVLQWLSTPICDVETLSLQLLQQLINWNDILKSLSTQEKFLEYLFKYSQNKEIFDLKHIVIRQILYVTDQEPDNSILKNFGSTVRQTLQNKNKPQQDVQYETQVE